MELSCHTQGGDKPSPGSWQAQWWTGELTSPGSRRQPCPPLENSMTQVRGVGLSQSLRTQVMVWHCTVPVVSLGGAHWVWPKHCGLQGWHPEGHCKSV